MPDTPPPPQSPRTNDCLAYLVVIFAFIGLTWVSIAVISSANTEKAETSRFVFVGLTGLIGAWVGTVLAHYFQKENLMAATQSITQIAQNATLSDRLRSKTVRSTMIEMAKIKSLPGKFAAEKDYTKIPLQELAMEMGKGGHNRLPLFKDNGAIAHVAHLSYIEKHLAERATFAPASPPGTPPAALPPAPTLASFLEDSKTKTLLATSKAFVKIGDTLLEAKAALDGIPGCADIFVTETGQASEPVLGWLTDVIIAQHARA